MLQHFLLQPELHFESDGLHAESCNLSTHLLSLCFFLLSFRLLSRSLQTSSFWSAVDVGEGGEGGGAEDVVDLRTFINDNNVGRCAHEG